MPTPTTNVFNATIGADFIIHAPDKMDAMARYDGQRGRVTGFCGETTICDMGGGCEMRISGSRWAESCREVGKVAGPTIGAEFVVKAGSVEYLQSIDGARGKVSRVSSDSKTFTASVNGQEWYLETFLWGVNLIPAEKSSDVSPQIVRAIVGRAVADRALVARGAKTGRMTVHASVGQFSVIWNEGGWCDVFSDADFGVSVHPCDPKYLTLGGSTLTIVAQQHPADPRDAEIARLKSELAAATSKGSAIDGRTLGDALGTVATQRTRIRALEVEEERTSFALACKDREIAKLKLAVKERAWRR